MGIAVDCGRKYLRTDHNSTVLYCNRNVLLLYCTVPVLYCNCTVLLLYCYSTVLYNTALERFALYSTAICAFFASEASSFII